MGAIFISYRRDDSEGHAGRLAEDLAERFGPDAVFFDVSTIAPGEDFRRAIDDNVARCSVLLAVIGPRWLDAAAGGARRLDDPGDFVRLEIGAALRRRIAVVPVLVQGAKMAPATALPADLSDLAYRNAVELTHARWPSDVDVLARSLAAHVGATPMTRAAAAAKPRLRLWLAAVTLLGAGVAAAAFLMQPAPGPAPTPADDSARIAALVAQTNDEETATRKAAMARLLAEHRSSGAMVGLAVDRLSETQFPRLGREGRVNALTLLVESDPAAWSAAQRQEARDALARIRSKVAAGQAMLGPQVTELMARLEARLAGAKAGG